MNKANIDEIFEGRKKNAHGGRIGYDDGQLVAPTVDGSRPGYSGLLFRLLKFVKNFKKTFERIPTITEIRKATGAAPKKIKNLLDQGTDFIVTSPKDVATAAGLKGGAKRKEIAGSVSEVSSDLIKEVNATNKKGMAVSIETSTYGSQFIRLRLTDDAIKIFGEEWLPATKENLKIIKTKINKIEKSSEYKNVEPFKTSEYFRKLKNLKKARYKKQDPFRIYEKLQEYKTKKFPGTLSSDIQIQHGQPKFDTQTLSRWGLIPEKVQTIPAVVRAERIRNKLLSSALVKLKNPKRSIADKEKIIEKFNDTMKGLRGQLKGTDGQGLVNFELLKLDKEGNVVRLKDVGFDPNKGLAYGEELGQLDLAKISQEQADQIIALGKKKIDLELLRQVLPSKLKNIVNPLPPSRYYEAGGRVGFKDGGGADLSTPEGRLLNKQQGTVKILNKILENNKIYEFSELAKEDPAGFLKAVQEHKLASKILNKPGLVKGALKGLSGWLKRDITNPLGWIGSLATIDAAFGLHAYGQGKTPLQALDETLWFLPKSWLKADEKMFENVYKKAGFTDEDFGEFQKWMRLEDLDQQYFMSQRQLKYMQDQVLGKQSEADIAYQKEVDALGAYQNMGWNRPLGTITSKERETGEHPFYGPAVDRHNRILTESTDVYESLKDEKKSRKDLNYSRKLAAMEEANRKKQMQLQGWQGYGLGDKATEEMLHRAGKGDILFPEYVHPIEGPSVSAEQMRAAGFADGGLTRTVARDSRPMHQGLRSLYINDKDY